MVKRLVRTDGEGAVDPARAAIVFEMRRAGQMADQQLVNLCSALSPVLFYFYLTVLLS